MSNWIVLVSSIFWTIIPVIIVLILVSVLINTLSNHKQEREHISHEGPVFTIDYMVKSWEEAVSWGCESDQVAKIPDHKSGGEVGVTVIVNDGPVCSRGVYMMIPEQGDVHDSKNWPSANSDLKMVKIKNLTEGETYHIELGAFAGRKYTVPKSQPDTNAGAQVAQETGAPEFLERNSAKTVVTSKMERHDAKLTLSPGEVPCTVYIVHDGTEHKGVYELDISSLENTRVCQVHILNSTGYPIVLTKGDTQVLESESRVATHFLQYGRVFE